MSDAIKVKFANNQKVDVSFGKTEKLDVSLGKGCCGTSNYEALTNQPQINDVTLIGNKSFEDLGDSTLTNIEIKAIFDRVFGGE